MIRVFPDLERASRVLARRILRTATSALEVRGRFDLVLSGGSTPRRTYELIAESSRENRALWENTHVYWGDERFVPHDDEASNYLLARRALLDRVAIPRANVHAIPTSGDDPAQSALEYSRVFPASPDVFLLGMGADGHTASLFPKSAEIECNERGFISTRGPSEPRRRISATRATIRAAREVLVLVAGGDKSDVLLRVFADGGSVEATPARTASDGDWYADAAAAAGITALGGSWTASVDIEIIK